MRRSIAMIVFVLVALLGTASMSQARTTGISSETSAQVRSLRSGIVWHRQMTWRYQDRAGVARTRTNHAERRTESLPYLRWIDKLWAHRQQEARKLGSSYPPHHALWMCLHSVEGPWHDTSSPYAGGLQMSIGWLHMVNNAGYLSPLQQEWIAEKAYAANHYSGSFIYGQWIRWESGRGDKCIPLE